MSFDRTTGAWSILGQASDVRRSDERSGILDALRDSAEAMSPTAIASALDMPVNNVKQLLFKMVKSGEVAKTKRGQYLNPLNLVNPITNGRAPSCS
jgi:3-deoxy-D-manno-octulosonic acid (KDO) 8-phosphate synthase